MTEGEENIIIKGVLLEAISRDFSEELSNNKEVSVSPRFKRQMMAMMNNPNKWAERHKRDYRRRFVKVVATIVLTCSLPFGVLTVASPTVRAAVIDWVVEWYESSIIYKFFGESDSTKLPLYEVIDLPFDYTRIGIPQELPNNTEIIYENSDGEILRFEYMRVEEGSAIICIWDMDWFSGMMENCLSTGPKKKELSVRQRLKLLIAWLTVTQRS